ncbi:Sporulation and spore germination [Evansella caseinilytica]|uniref:Sporulation and spore germination n=1 Tax=Evansella caseinilytica TaxID=1503961 RepID=A0A1H3QIK7_9BACI|nr:GerMN domain-containing protein [Evansella caseinilytica]SDZ12539.1 Sporulation and spore germination [Evansella caseinilytica]
MKKILLTLTSLSLVLFITACGQGNDEEQSTPIDETGGNQTQEEDDANNNEDAAENEEDSLTDESEETADNTSTEEDAVGEAVAMIDNLVLYFADDQLMETYRVETGVSVTVDEAGAKQAFELWLAGPDHEDLVSLLPEATKVQSVTFKDNVAYVSFSADILEANLGSTGELMVTEQMALISEQFGYDKTQILVEGEVPESFLGHMDVSDPVPAEDPDNYDELD